MGIKQNKEQEPKGTVKSKSQGIVKKASSPSTSETWIQRATSYFAASRVELGKVSWPTWKEVKATGLAVAGLVVVMSLFLGVVDLFLSWVIKSILSIGI